MQKEILILDCFVDEPACLGVPPFISPYPRYIYGALLDAGLDENSIVYNTIDLLRENKYKITGTYSHVIIIGGAVVPGKYLGEKIGTLTEITKIIQENPYHNIIIGGQIKDVLPRTFQNAQPAKGDIEKYIYNIIKGKTTGPVLRSTREIASWSVLGASMVTQHTHYPEIICEIETARGCPRERHCSFCSEGLFQPVEFRSIPEILAEIDALIANGVKRFRIGRQADIIQYQTRMKQYKEGFPKPEPSAVKELFTELHNRTIRGEIEVLAIDNANPGSIYYYPSESTSIIESLCTAVTPGETMALGFESFDEHVIKNNNLKVNARQAVQVISLINEIGKKRIKGIPILLPGVNLVHGLNGENMNTFKQNYETLLAIKENGSLIKRINIRKLQPYPGTQLYTNRPTIPPKTVNRFEYYRTKIRHDIDNYMLKKIYPAGTILNKVQVLETHNGYSYGKQISSYPITLKYPLILDLKKFYKSIIIGHSERSLLALPLPIRINQLEKNALEKIPGISRKMASTIVLERPFFIHEELRKILGNINSIILENIVL